MGNHSDICGGSSAKRYINCIGSDALIKKAPKPKSSVFAHLGTVLHYAIEDVLDKDLDPIDLIGDSIQLDEHDIDPETGEPAIIELTDKLITTKVVPALDWFDEELNPEEFWLEQEVHFTKNLKGAFGSADVLFMTEGRAGLVDWKFGDGVMVSAEDNYQMMFYLAAALEAPWWSKATECIDEFEAYIVQPTEKSDIIASSATYTRGELAMFRTKLSLAKKLKDQGDETLTVGDHCQWCPAQPICKAWRDKGKQLETTLSEIPVEKEVYKSGDKKGLEKPVTPKKQAATTLDYFDATELRETYLDAVAIKKWADATIDYVKDMISWGTPIEGLKRVVFNEHRTWADEKKALNWVRRQGLTADDYYTPKNLKSLAQIEKLLDVPIKDELVSKTPAGYQIVPNDDPRPAVFSADAEEGTSLSNQLADSLGGAQGALFDT